MIPRFPAPCALADIGGTNARFALVDDRGGAIGLVVKLPTADYPSFEAAFRAALDRLGRSACRSLLVAAAGPHVGPSTIQLTNATWRLDGPALAQGLDLDQGLLLNDFEALSLALPVLGGAELQILRPGPAGARGPRVAFGPGTGLGVGALLELDSRFAPVKSEGSHVEIGPATQDEFVLWPHLDRPSGRMGAEDLLSGRGLERLHRGLLCRDGTGGPARTAAEIIERALDRSEPACVEAAHLFLRLVGRVAGDMAITFCATGGVTLGGGILPRLATLIPASDLLPAFLAKAPVGHLVGQIGLSLVLEPDRAAFAGLAALAARPERYLIDYAGRCWREEDGQAA